jgi:hypothetical protein
MICFSLYFYIAFNFFDKILKMVLTPKALNANRARIITTNAKNNLFLTYNFEFIIPDNSVNF